MLGFSKSFLFNFLFLPPLPKLPGPSLLQAVSFFFFILFFQLFFSCRNGRFVVVGFFPCLLGGVCREMWGFLGGDGIQRVIWRCFAVEMIAIFSYFMVVEDASIPVLPFLGGSVVTFLHLY